MNRSTASVFDTDSGSAAMALGLMPPRADVLQAVRQFIDEQLNLRLGSFLDKAEQTLTESWRESRNPADWTDGRRAVEWLSTHKHSIREAMYARMVSSLMRPRAAQAGDLSDLRLMNVEELSLTLARATLVNRVMECARGTVIELEARLETLRRGRLGINPGALGPGPLADCFQAILQEQGVPPKAQTVLMGAFGDRSVQELIGFYTGLNALLSEHRVEPTFPRGMARSSSAPSGKSLRRDLLADRLSRLQDTVGALALAAWRPGFLRTQLEAGLKVQSPEAAKETLSPAQLRQIDHIEAYFLEMLRDERISERIRGELRRLILPLMAARLPAPQQFDSPDSPVRVFVRQLALLGYRDQEAPLQDFDMIQALIGRIVSENGQVLDSFHSGAEALYTLARRQLRRLKDAVNGTADGTPASRPGERLPAPAEARRQVMIELREHAAGLRLEQPVRVFVLRLLGPWMMVRYLRYGEGSPPWSEARAFAALFFDALRPALDEREQTRKRALRRQTLIQARLRIERSRAPKKEAEDLLAWLEAQFAWLDRQPEPGDAETGVPVPADHLAFLDELPQLETREARRPG